MIKNNELLLEICKISLLAGDEILQIYNDKIEIIDNKKVSIDMTLTSPNCPVAEELPNEVKTNIMKIDGVDDVNLKLVWDPPWTKEKMSEAAQLELDYLA